MHIPGKEILNSCIRILILIQESRIRIVIRIATKSIAPRATPTSPKISSQSVHNFLSNQADRKKQRNGQTNAGKNMTSFHRRR